MKTNKYLIQSVTKLLLLAAIAIPLGGCDILLPSPPPPPRPAVWTSAPGFSSASIPKIAILVEYDYRENGGGFPTTIEDIFMRGAFQKGYRVSDRSDVARVLQEIRFEQSGLTEDDAAKLGRMLNVPAVLLVKVTGMNVTAQPTGLIINGANQYNYTSRCEISTRLIGVESAEVLGLCDYAAATPTSQPRDYGAAIVLAAGQIASVLPTIPSQ